MATANSGKGNREVVQALINDMHSFNEVVGNEISTMMNRTERLGESWRDAQYNQFSGFMTELSEALKRDLATLEEAANALQKKVNMY